MHVNVTRHVDSTQVEIEQALMLNFFNRAFPSDEISQKSAAQSFCVAKCVVSWLLRKSTIANQVQSERAAFMSVALEWEILKKRTHQLGELNTLTKDYQFKERIRECCPRMDNLGKSQLTLEFLESQQHDCRIY